MIFNQLTDFDLFYYKSPTAVIAKLKERHHVGTVVTTASVKRTPGHCLCSSSKALTCWKASGWQPTDMPLTERVFSQIKSLAEDFTTERRESGGRHCLKLMSTHCAFLLLE